MPCLGVVAGVPRIKSSGGLQPSSADSNFLLGNSSTAGLGEPMSLEEAKRLSVEGQSCPLITVILVLLYFQHSHVFSGPSLMYSVYSMQGENVNVLSISFGLTNTSVVLFKVRESLNI